MSVLRSISRIMALLPVAAVAVSCAQYVLEDRIGCPGNLFVYLDNTRSNVTADSRGTHVIAENRDGTTIERLVRYDDAPDGLIINVGLGVVDIYAYAGIEKMDFGDYEISVPEGGESCDSLFTYHRAVDFTTGYGQDHVTLRKQFTTVSVKYPGLSDMLTLYIRGNNNAIDRRTGEVVGTSFKTKMYRSGEDLYSCRVIRQKGYEMWLDVMDGSSPVKQIAFTSTLRSLKWDWTKTDLDDFVMMFDKNGKYISTTITGYLDNDYYKAGADGSPEGNE